VEFTPDEKGKYVVEAYIVGTSISAVTEVTAGDFGEVTEIVLKAKPAILSSEKEDKEMENGVLTVELIDENGIVKSYEFGDYDDDFIFSTSDATLATVGRADGLITVKKDASGIVTFTVVDRSTGLSDSVDVPIAGKPATIDVDVDSDGLDAKVTMTLLDAKDIKADAGKKDDSYTVLADELEVKNIKKFKDGEATFELVADDYGTYSVKVVSDLGIAKTFDVTFSEKAKPADAADVMMFIGSNSFVQDGKPGTMNVAPFIEDGRTFVPIRFIGEAFGAEFDWEPKEAATEKVYVISDDIEITITIGEYTIEVVKDGETETVVSDVAAFIKEGRTFLPLRAIGEILGAEFDWGPKDADTEWVSFSRQ